MEISKFNKTVSAEVTEQIQNLDSQASSETEAKPVGLVQDDSIERMQALDPFTASFKVEYSSEQPDLSAYSGSGGQTQLGHGTADNNSEPVSQSYAAKAEEDKPTVSDPNSYSAIRKEIAGALGVDESDPVVDQTYQSLVFEMREIHEARRVAENEATVEAALNNGRRVEESIPGTTETIITEFVPGERTENLGDMKVFLRAGNEIKDGDATIRTIRYYDSGSFSSIGQVKSVIEDGIETILEVTPNPNFPGAIALKPGDQRPVPDKNTTSAGLAPSTWDPQPDGRYGSTSKSISTDTKAEHPSSNEPQDPSRPVSFGGSQPGNESGGTQSGSTQSGSTQSGSSGSDPSEWAPYPGGSSGSGSASDASSGGDQLYIQGTDVRDDGSVLITLSDGSSHEFSSVQQAMDWTKQQNLSPPPSSSSPTTDDEETNTSVEGNTTVEVEEPEQEEETEEDLAEEEETNENDDGYRAAYGDYADSGSEPSASISVGSYSEITTANTVSSNHTFTDRYNYNPGYADKPGGPTDFGNANDPIGDPNSLDVSQIYKHLGPNPVTDPANPGEGGVESVMIESIEQDMAGTLRDGMNPLDENDAMGFADLRPKTGEADHSTGEPGSDLP